MNNTEEFWRISLILSFSAFEIYILYNVFLFFIKAMKGYGYPVNAGGGSSRDIFPRIPFISPVKATSKQKIEMWFRAFFMLVIGIIGGGIIYLAVIN